MSDVAIKAEHGHATATGISNTKLAMWVYLGSDCLLFGSLISTYLLLRHRSVTGLGPEEVFDIPFTSVSSFVLLMSSLTMALAVASISRGDVHRNRV
ncbi:MAG: cytochrome oxidase subunit III, partial [Acidimicrobiales bacterium]